MDERRVRIATGLKVLGATWHTSPRKQRYPGETRRHYHVVYKHAIWTFVSLTDLEAWIDEQDYATFYPAACQKWSEIAWLDEAIFDAPVLLLSRGTATCIQAERLRAVIDPDLWSGIGAPLVRRSKNGRWYVTWVRLEDSLCASKFVRFVEASACVGLRTFQTALGSREED